MLKFGGAFAILNWLSSGQNKN